ncbi:restriction endonuclease subunit S [Dyadobacter sp. CY345]|uniref:restriction endonuclease subunit S n=1 Tax=Dyadobacter sp. CY345 TaxID=2909335 RepID=UPI001F3B6F8A|nr:restriction endonuclease subunit S [Dyadobacter sp. CY345]MCF2446816.1 restriction endonuclease subunit S [Dyadobacter sp. CY345]
MFKKYSEYKDSGVEWLGEVPENWVVKKMKFLGFIYPGLSGKKGDDFSKEYQEEFKYFIPFTNICNNPKISLGQYQYVKINEGELQNKVRKDDILFLMSSETLEEIAKCSIYLGNDQELYLNSFCKGFRIIDSNALPEFINYLLTSSTYRSYFSLVGRGFTRINLKQEYINDAFVPLPSRKEQTAIANFLDRKTAQIDQAVSIKEKQIELLKERRQILIHNAVTRGLDLDVKMKNSGVEWIGEIPEHWEIQPIKYLLNGVVDCEHSTAPFVDDPTYFVVRTSNVKSGNLTLEDAKYTHEKGYLRWTRRGVPEPGDILLTREAPAGEACLVPSDMKICLGQRMVWLKVDKAKLDSKLAIHLIYSKMIRTYIDFLSSGSTVLHFNMSDINNIPITLMPIEEQIRIREYIESHSQKIATAISLKQKEIEKLKEYKSTLINSAVTGKIKV